jgi:hypothetical protein
LLSWVLLVLVVITAVLTLGLSYDVFVKYPNPPDTLDYVERLLQYRAYDTDTYGLRLVEGLVGVGIFVVAALLGVAIRWLAPAGAPRNLMATLFVLGGAVGVVAQLFNIAIAKSGTFGYCDCGYKSTEVIGLGYALGVAITTQTWLALASVTLVGIGTAVAGRIIDLGQIWRLLSYGIAIALIAAVLLLFLDYGQESNLVVGLTLILGVPAWLILLARGSAARTAAAVA